MKIDNAIYGDITLQISSYPIKAGTPVSRYGVESNDANACGIITQQIDNRPIFDTVRVLIGGDVVLSECETLYGSSYTDDAKKAMDGIRFRVNDGTIYTPSIPQPTIPKYYRHNIKLHGTVTTSEVENEYDIFAIFYSSDNTQITTISSVKELVSTYGLCVYGGKLTKTVVEISENYFYFPMQLKVSVSQLQAFFVYEDLESCVKTSIMSLEYESEYDVESGDYHDVPYTITITDTVTEL